MSEKATLLTSIPSVSKKTDKELAVPEELVSESSQQDIQLSSIPALSKKRDTKSDVVTVLPKEPTTGPESKEEDSSVQTEVPSVVQLEVAETNDSLTGLQTAVYVSHVLSFCVAGFLAIVLLRKASSLVEGRLKAAFKTQAVVCGVLAIGGFFCSYLFSQYLGGEAKGVPLVPSVAVWVLCAPFIALTLHNIISSKENEDKGALVVDSVVYVLIFLLALLGVSSGIKPNAALILSILSGFLLIVPVARITSTLKTAKAKQPALAQTSLQLPVYALIVFPALLPIASIAHVFGLRNVGSGGEMTQILINLAVLCFALVASITLVASAKNFQGQSESDSVSKKVAGSDKVPSFATGKASGAEAPSNTQRRVLPATLPRSAPAASQAATPTKVSAPMKPSGVRSSDKSPAPNAPSRIKAPAKPKKRF